MAGKVFSANKAAWLLMNNIKLLGSGTVLEDGQCKSYLEFQELEEVKELFEEYRNPKTYKGKIVFDFLRHYKRVRNIMANAKIQEE